MTEKEIIDKYFGIPHRHLGRDLSGLDCWGLIKMIYADIGIEVFDLKDYDEQWAMRGGNYFIENYYEDWVWHTAPVFLDVLLFRNCKGIPSHAGIYLSKGKFIHSARKAGVAIAKLKDYLPRLEGIYRNNKL